VKMPIRARRGDKIKDRMSLAMDNRSPGPHAGSDTGGLVPPKRTRRCHLANPSSASSIRSAGQARPGS
jgi:hypothetical protein